jgi:hypothetical protein
VVLGGNTYVRVDKDCMVIADAGHGGALVDKIWSVGEQVRDVVAPGVEIYPVPYAERPH